MDVFFSAVLGAYVSVMSLVTGQKCGTLSCYRERNAKDESVFVKGKRSSRSEGKGHSAYAAVHTNTCKEMADSLS